MQTPGKIRVACAMSGGVDSSVAAALLCAQGYDVIGMTMQVWPETAECDRACCAPSAIKDARRVATQLGIPHYVINFQEEFHRVVIDDFIAEYRRGRTPNPCIRCNRWIKFVSLLAQARTLGAEYLATGHYAQVACHADTGRWSIRRGLDAKKDQSYALYGLTQEQLAHTLLPLGGMEKPRTREIAAELGLRVAQKPDSQEICFISDNDYGRFLREVAPDAVAPGPMVDSAGRQLGTHAGVAFYTIGQRHGLGLPGGAVRYVIRLDPARNTVVVGAQEELFQSEVQAEDIIFGKWDAADLHDARPVTAMLRYKMAPQPASARMVGERLTVTFTTPQRAITPGQALVCYDGEDVTCGGTIV